MMQTKIYVLLGGIIAHFYLTATVTVNKIDNIKDLLAAFGRSKITSYQDVFANGIVYPIGLSHGFQNRFDAMKTHVLNLYRRPITVLDLGAAQGLYSFLIANQFDATCVMIDPDDFYHSPEHGSFDPLESLCHINSRLSNIILLKKHISLKELRLLADCEHFDVVLAMNVIHHFGEQWHEAFNILMDMGENILIETPTKDDFACGKFIEIADFFDRQDGEVIAKSPSHTKPSVLRNLYLFKRKKTALKRKNIYADFFEPSDDNACKFYGKYKIVSNLDKKVLIKDFGTHKKESVWFRGINLLTFKELGGVFPDFEMLKTAADKMYAEYAESSDYTPANIILQGQRLVLIDTSDPRMTSGPEGFIRSKCPERHQMLLNWLAMTDPTKAIPYLFGVISQPDRWPPVRLGSPLYPDLETPLKNKQLNL